jgi:1-(5-phosphoribosyl)-5-[(5-phosphoribosylamino)methylideneamino] imidazole-4-carboxamide isomerase/N-(5'phosphoribosyl)anthranilate isomerase
VILLPAVDIRDGRCVRLSQGDFDRETVYDDDPVAVAKRYESEGAEWLHVVDLDAALQGVPKNRELVADVIRSVEIPVQCSGGIRDAAAVDAAHDAGARRVVIGTAALRDPAFVEETVEKHGDFVAVGLDVRGQTLQARGWTEEAGELWPTLVRLVKNGVQRFIVTDVMRDGMLEGPNLTLLAEVLDYTDRPVVASGGVSSVEDLRRLASIRVEGCIVGKALYAGRFTLPEALQAAG